MKNKNRITITSVSLSGLPAICGLPAFAAAICLALLFGAAAVTKADAVAGEIDWPAFIRRHDMTFDKLPANWKAAPHFGNAMVGSMLYATGGKIRLQLFRADVQDHRDDTYGWAGYSRAHLMIGDFHLETVGKPTGCNWRKDLWNAELTGVITTDKGEIRIRHYTHAEDMAIVTELTPSAGEHVRVPLDLAPDESIFVVFRQPGKPEPDPYVRVEGPARKPDPLLIRRATYGALDGNSQNQADVTAALAARMHDGRLLTTVNKALVNRDPAPKMAKQLRVEYEWAGTKYTTTVPENALVMLPPAHLLPESWVAGFEAGEGTRLRAWDNGPHALHRAFGKTERIEVNGLPEPLTLPGPWTLRFQPGRGAPAEARLDSLISWSDHPDPGIRYFSGTATTSTRFELPKGFLQEGQEVWLDLGEVAVMAEVRLNQQNLGILWHRPFRIEINKALRPGSNTIEVDVTNLWVNRLIGDEQHPADCEWNGSFLTRWPDWLTNGKPRPQPSRITFTTWKHWNANDPLLPSGLLGPVTLRPARLVAVP